MNLTPLTYLTAEKGSPIFTGASVIKAEKQTPGEIGRRKAQLGAVVDKALEEKSALLILPGELEAGVQFELVSNFGGPGRPAAEPDGSPFAELEAELETREKAAAAKEAELAEREADLVAREKKVKAAEKKLAASEDGGN